MKRCVCEREREGERGRERDEGRENLMKRETSLWSKTAIIPSDVSNSSQEYVSTHSLSPCSHTYTHSPLLHTQKYTHTHTHSLACLPISFCVGEGKGIQRTRYTNTCGQEGRGERLSSCRVREKMRERKRESWMEKIRRGNEEICLHNDWD